MARRAIQASAFDKGAPDKKLEQQIDWLKDSGVVTDQIARVAHRLRLAGNIGAHPDKDGLKDVEEDDARGLLHFLDDFLRFVYEIPGRLEEVERAAPEPPDAVEST